jgi:hypothetical protein
MAIVLAHIGAHAVIGGLEALGWQGFVAVCALHAGGLACDAYTLARCAEAPYLACLKATFAGHGINAATPFGSLGEVSKYGLLRRHVPSQRLVAAILAQNAIRLVTQLLLIALVPPIAAWQLGLEGRIAALFALASTLLIVVATTLLLLLRQGVGAWPFAIARRLPLVGAARAARAEAWWREVEHHARPRELVTFASATAGNLFGAAQLLVILRALGAGSVAIAFLLYAAAQIVAWLTAFVPLQAGTAEGGAYLFFRAIGRAPHAGVIVELVRKARSLVFVMIAAAIFGAQALQRTEPTAEVSVCETP